MTNEKLFFYYEKNRKQQAKILIFNMFFLPFVFWLFVQLTQDNLEVYNKFSEYLKYILAILEVVLIATTIWLLTHPEKFYIKLTNSEFSSYHPIYKEWTFSVNPQEIIEIEQKTDNDAQLNLISIQMHNGSSFLLCPNYSFNRKKLYTALVQVNPNIKIPKNTWLFSKKT